MRFCFIFFLILTSTCSSFATHIRAGEITIVRVSGDAQEYNIRLIIYTDTNSPVEPGGGTLSFGDGISIDNIKEFSDHTYVVLDHGIVKNTYTFTHIYSGGIEEYTISYMELNRNPGIINMVKSENTAFYIEISFMTETPCYINTTPVLLIPPIDYAVPGKLFVHNPGAYDLEGDSISYELVVPRQAMNQVVNGYFFPENLTINHATGRIQWTAPNTIGEYNIALSVNEWRYVADCTIHLSSTVRDMQIILVDNSNTAPDILLPPDTCLTAGEYISADISVSDLDVDLVKLESFGQVYSPGTSPAKLNPDSIFYGEIPVIKSFQWWTHPDHIRPLPYKIHFKAADHPETSLPLADIKTWKILVSAPAPENIIGELLENGRIQLSWDKYSYGAERIRITRRIVKYDIPGGSCITGIPEFAGYETIDEVPGNVTGFLDNHLDGRFARGANYCYRLVAIIPGCSESESTTSEDVCIQIPVDAPVITNVSVNETNDHDGSVYVRWTSSFDLDSGVYNPSNLSYSLLRAEGLIGKNNAEIITPQDFTDTIFDDKGVDTENLAFNYTVYLYENNILIDSSATASTVQLVSEPIIGKIGLQWNAEVPWSINTQKYPYHYIYRNHVSSDDKNNLQLIDSVNVNLAGYHYTDSSDIIRNEGNETFCYYVMTSGSYGYQKIVDPLINNSQIFCTHPYDTVPPCQPELAIDNSLEENCYSFISTKPCNFVEYYNDLTIFAGCNSNDIVGYNIYYSKTGNDQFEFLFFTDKEQFRHEHMESFKGCYMVSAIDYSDNESTVSEIICRDNCPYFELPNVFTPNTDGYNDQFTEFFLNPAQCPRFVEKVDFFVYNRYGTEIYHSRANDEEKFWIEWDGIDKNNKKVGAGIYFFKAQVYFDVLNLDEKIKIYKGWVGVHY